jgi:hypothetical protein
MNNDIEVTPEELEEIVEEIGEEVLAEEPEPAREGHHPKWYHRQRAHVPGPRRKRKFAPTPAPVVEEKSVAEAPAEAEDFDEDYSENTDG